MPNKGMCGIFHGKIATPSWKNPVMLYLSRTNEMCGALPGTSTDRNSGDREDSSTHHRDQDMPPKTTANDSFTDDVKDTVERFWLLTHGLTIQVLQC